MFEWLIVLFKWPHTNCWTWGGGRFLGTSCSHWATTAATWTSNYLHVYDSGSDSGGRHDAKTDVVKAGRCLVCRLVLTESHRSLIVSVEYTNIRSSTTCQFLRMSCVGCSRRCVLFPGDNVDLSTMGLLKHVMCAAWLKHSKKFTMGIDASTCIRASSAEITGVARAFNGYK